MHKKKVPSAINSHLLRKITEAIMHVIQIQNAFYLVPLCDAAYVRKQTSTSAPLNAVMMIQCLWAGQSYCLAGACTIEGKGTDHPWHIQNMAVALGFHPNQMQNNAVILVTYLHLGLHFLLPLSSFSFYYLLFVLLFLTSLYLTLFCQHAPSSEVWPFMPSGRSWSLINIQVIHHDTRCVWLTKI